MKTRTLFLICILATFSISALRAQDSGVPPVKPALQVQQNPAFIPGDPADPKMTPEQKEMLLRAGEENPSKPVIPPDTRSADYGADPEKYCGNSNAKPAAGITENPLKEEQERAALAKQVQPVVSTANPTGNPGKPDQPEGQKPKNVTDFRKISGSSDQPAAPANGKKINYREISGPNDQPKGSVPGK